MRDSQRFMKIRLCCDRANGMVVRRHGSHIFLSRPIWYRTYMHFVESSSCLLLRNFYAVDERFSGRKKIPRQTGVLIAQLGPDVPLLTLHFARHFNKLFIFGFISSVPDLIKEANCFQVQTCSRHHFFTCPALPFPSSQQCLHHSQATCMLKGQLPNCCILHCMWLKFLEDLP